MSPTPDADRCSIIFKVITKPKKLYVVNENVVTIQLNEVLVGLLSYLPIQQYHSTCRDFSVIIHC